MKAIVLKNGILAEEIISSLEGKGIEVTAVSKADDIDESRFADGLDLLVLTTGEKDYELSDGAFGEGRDYDGLVSYLSERLIERHYVIEKCIPLLEKGKLKRFAFAEYRDGSVSDNHDTEGFAYHMIQAQMNMHAKILHENYRLRRTEDKFTVRCFAAERDADERKKGISAADYMLLDFSSDDRYDPKHYEENLLKLRDHYFVEIPW